VHPVTGVLHRSVLKPIGTTFTNKTVDFHSGKVSEFPLNHLVVMTLIILLLSWEVWKMWMDALKAENLLAPGATTVAYI
jgi:enoyl-[acyl-carrier protein] reductase/trans-2-enoyl-CoA reductase (NAD+)